MRSRTPMFLCADNSFSFYFSIQTKPYPRRQARRQFERRPYFLANLLSLRQTTHSPGSFSSHNDGSTRIYAPSLLLCLFILAHCVVITMVITKPTLTNLFKFWPATTLSMFTLQPHIRRRDAITCHRHPRRPYCRQQAPRPTFCARLTIKRTSSLALPLSV